MNLTVEMKNITKILLFATLGALAGACTASCTNSEPYSRMVCREDVWDRVEAGTLTEAEIWSNMAGYGCRLETKQEAIQRAGWKPTNYTPWVIILGLIGATIGAVSIKRNEVKLATEIITCPECGQQVFQPEGWTLRHCQACGSQYPWVT